MKLILWTVFTFISVSSLAQQFTITEMTNTPAPVTNNAVCEGYFNGWLNIYSFGGMDATLSEDGDHLEVYRFNTLANYWETLAPLPDTSGKVAAGASRVGDTIYIAGGYHIMPNGDEYTSHKMHRYVTTTNTYLTDAPDIPVPTDDHVQAVWRDSLIYLITGWKGTSVSGANINTIQVYNPQTNTWIGDTILPTPTNTYNSFGASGAIAGDTIYYYGGVRMSGFTAQEYLRIGIINPNNPLDIAWRDTVFDSQMTGYRMAATTYFDDHVFWIGGSSLAYNFDGLEYGSGNPVDPAGRIITLNTVDNSWSTTPYDLPMDLRGVGKKSENELYLVGGMISGPQASNKCLKLTLDQPNGISEIHDQTELIIFPNPCKKITSFIINTSNLESPSIEIIDYLGRSVSEFKIKSGRPNTIVNHLESGVYTVIAKSGTSLNTKRLVICE